MTRPGFRKGRGSGGKSATARSGQEGFVSGALFSQAQILHLMKMEFARSRRHRMPLGCLLLQVDRMPQLVDLYGAELRTAVRDAFARLVREKTRGADLLGTISDDRYLLMLPQTDLMQTRAVAERLHGMFTDVEVAVGGRPLAVTLSIGLTAASEQTMFFDTLVNQAETALEWAMNNGGNRITSFGETQLLGDAPPSPDKT